MPTTDSKSIVFIDLRLETFNLFRNLYYSYVASGRLISVMSLVAVVLNYAHVDVAYLLVLVTLCKGSVLIPIVNSTLL